MNTRNKDIEEEMWDAAEILALAVERVQKNESQDLDQAKLELRRVFGCSKMFAERYRAYVKDLTRLT